jgi:anti-anti-sigma factor
VTTLERLRVEQRTAPDRVVLELHGELDLSAAPLLAAEIERAENGEHGVLVLDLENLDFVDSAGLRVILAAHERALGSSREFAITTGTPQVRRLFEIAGVGEHLRTIDQPLAALAPGDADSPAP